MQKLLGLLVVPFVLGCAANGSVPLDGARMPTRAAQATDLGRLAPDTELDFVVGLTLHDTARLHKLVSDRGPNEDGLAPDDFADRFAPSALEYRRVVQWLAANGVFIVRTTPGRTSISAHATAAAVERAFGVELHRYADRDGTFSAAAGPLNVAPELVGVVAGVVGLSGSGGWRPHLYFPDLSAGARLTPTDMETLYNSAGISNPGMGETVAILGSGRAPDPTKDVGGFMTSFKPYALTTAPGYSQVLVGGPGRDDANTMNGEYIENCLDAEMVLGMAPLANVVHVLTATNSPGLFTDGISYIVNQVPQAHAVTVSYGTCERGAAGEMPVVDTLLQQAEAEGQQWFFASGDSGTDGCRDGSGNKHISAGWPASSPYAVGVGGTEIGTGGVEVTWNDNASGGGAGGGGPSEALAKPAYQTGRTPDDGARDTPDVAAIAGGGGVWIAVQGQHGTVGGTSAAAPVWAGAWALVDQGKGGKGITDALTKMYMVGAAGGFNDITAGDNGGPDSMSPGYPAGTGYDLATGWGTPNVAKLITTLP